MHPFRQSQHSLNADASPSISLERGRYRMRAPRPINPVPPIDYAKASKLHQPAKNRPLGVDLLNRNLALLLALLTLSCITCFAFAYYLFTSRWEHISRRDTFARTNGTTEAFGMEQRSMLRQESQKYLAYLPHSGLHNQRIALENALTLAHLLNRTLLVPPIRLGTKAIRYLPFDTLYSNLMLAGPEGLEHCGSIPPYLTLPVECLDYFDSTILGWGDIFDISQIEEYQKVVHLRTLSPSEYNNFFSPSPPGTLHVKDGTAYQFRYVETGSNTEHSASKYDETISISELAKAPHMLIQLGSLFGTNRLLLGEEAAAILKNIRAKMVMKHETLDGVSNNIKNRLSPSYIGLHLRVGDGIFSERREETVKYAWCLLLQRLGYTSGAIQEIHKHSGAWILSNSSFACLPGQDARDKLQALVHIDPERKYLRHSAFHALATPIFVSTDLKHPETEQLLRPFRQTFPRLYFSSDFREEMEPLHRIQNSDGVELYRFFLPIVEAMVVARAKVVVGTRGSTFSKFIEETLWPAYRTQTQSQL